MTAGERQGWGVAIRRSADGTSFLAGTANGILPAVWSQRRYAVAYKKELRTHGLDARVVPVRFFEPEIVS